MSYSYTIFVSSQILVDYSPVETAAAGAQHALPEAITVLATAIPQALFKQSRKPELKSTLLQKRAGSRVTHPKNECLPSILLKQILAHEGGVATSIAIKLVAVSSKEA